ncbi:gliding motility-associated C-terminal domain-containing protein [Aestuariibaculum sp. YM273]|uniref:gliding motility-associated C-terminal domain-containing protein n=1 Tax=Aestuariibaculum sp. YM273 TaxID=3070659 RepID=UPI0027DD040D|nr:gliding motility-associated C-terminal domain-containing protein [Aestuariibaculum sp. YM273]WMI65008.1 gliding motility-associated C-terminal domain-containing protein [Aestuariibaculum sp. YM273]
MTFTDTNNNETICTQDVVVTDNQAPVFDCTSLSDIIRNSDSETVCSNSDSVTAPVATDNCDGSITADGTRSDNAAMNDPWPVGTTTITWTFTDTNNNETICTQDVVVTDNQAPVFDCTSLSDIIRNSDSETVCSNSDSVTAPVATDNCDGSITADGTRSDNAAMNDPWPVGTTTITWTFTDTNNNETICTQDVMVTDNQAPVFDCTSLSDIIRNSDSETVCSNSDSVTAPVATDNCDGSITADGTRSDNAAMNDPWPVGTTTITWTFTDTNNNETICTQDVVVTDNQAPVFDCTSLSDIIRNSDSETVCSNSDSVTAPVATDNCDGSITADGTRSDNAAMNDPWPVGTTTITWTFTDTNNNETICTQDVVVTDNQAPKLNCPGDLTAACDISEQPAYSNFTEFVNAGGNANDNCSVNESSFTLLNEISDNLSCPETITRTYQISDMTGNTTTCTQLIIINDETPPIIDNSNIADINIECAVDDPQKLTDWLNNNAGATASDNCGDVTWTNNYGQDTSVKCKEGKGITITFTATDACGNSSETTAIYHIQDNIAPNLTTTASDYIAECDGSGNTQELDYWLASNGGATATDDCSSISWSNNFTSLSDDCGNTGSATVIFTATDACGNESTTTATFTIEDTTAPTFAEALPSDTIVQCDAVPTAETLTADDNCGTATVTFSEVRTDGDCPSSYSLARTWTATDECGLETLHTQTITVQDTTPPTFVEALPADTIVQCDAVPTAETLTATDNCGTASVTFSEVRTDGDCPSSYSLARTWTATDECGLETVHTQTITVQDTTPPTFVEALPADTIVECDAVPTAETLTADDNCGTATVTFSEVRTDGDCPSSYSLARTWTATDECGLETVHTQTITVQDTTPPTFVEALPADTIVECDAVPTAETLTADDNCGTATVTFSEVRTDGDCPSSYSLARTWTATDECGLETVHTQTITVQDTTPPTFVEALPADAIVECDAVPTAETLTATDNCGTATVTFSELRTDGDCPSSYSLARTWTATDECGLETVHTQTITVQDTTTPTFVETLPADTIVECDAVPTAETLTATDNCGAATVTFSEVRTDGDCPSSYSLTRSWTATDECGLETVHTQIITVQDTTAPALTVPADVTIECTEDGTSANTGVAAATDTCGDVTITESDTEVATCGNTKVITRTWTATDDCGNASTATQTITIVDTVAPTITAPDSVTIECSEDVTSVSTGIATATDTCGNVTITESDSEVAACGNTKVITRTWTATDDCGNASTATQTITVIDTTAPTFVETLPTDITVECDAVPTINDVVLTATDNCGNATVTVEDVRTDGSCPSSYSIARTWTATDDCGNSVSHTQNITVQDTKAPENITEYEETIAVTSLDIPDAPELEFTDCSEYTVEFTEESTFVENQFVDYQITRTWTAVDACGNESVYTQTVLIAIQTVTTRTTASPICYDDGAVDLRDIIEGLIPSDVNLQGVWEFIQGNDVATLIGSIFDPTKLQLGEDFNPGEVLEFLVKYKTTRDGSIFETELTLQVDSDCVVLPCGENDIEISKAVTPNGDSYNESFDIKGIELCGFVADVKIFNRWGALIYESSNYTLGENMGDWRGRSNKSSFGSSDTVPNGTYYYIITLKDSGLAPFTGPVYLGTK